MLAFRVDTRNFYPKINPVKFIFCSFLALLLSTGCAASYQERNDYLLEMAQRGVEVNKLFRGQGQEITEELCESANLALNDDIPSNRSWGYESTVEWEELVQETFVNACVSGEY